MLSIGHSLVTRRILLFAPALVVAALMLAFTPPERRLGPAVVAAIVFVAQGWARGNLFSPDGLPTTGVVSPSPSQA